MTPAFISLDWGTTSFRAYLVAGDGSVLDSRADQSGILSVKDGAFEAVFERQVAGWDVALPVLASGMITSRQGWLEVPYVEAPAGLAELSAGLRELRTASGRIMHFVPGVSMRDANGVPDVIRGEETQVIGACHGGSVLCVTRGTHCKWIEVRAGHITRFATFMTGELFAVLKQHSILGRLMTGDSNVDAGFFRGVQAGLREANTAGLLHALFSTRTLGLFGDLAGDQLASYLSGLLLGAEIAGARATFSTGATPIMVIGAAGLADPFVGALSIAGLAGQRAPDDVAVQGLAMIGKQTGLIT